MCFFFVSLTNKREWFLKRERERESLTFHTKRILLYTQQGEGEGDGEGEGVLGSVF
jgi:hypothetical protein